MSSIGWKFPSEKLSTQKIIIEMNNGNECENVQTQFKDNPKIIMASCSHIIQFLQDQFIYWPFSYNYLLLFVSEVDHQLPEVLYQKGDQVVADAAGLWGLPIATHVEGNTVIFLSCWKINSRVKKWLVEGVVLYRWVWQLIDTTSELVLGALSIIQMLLEEHLISIQCLHGIHHCLATKRGNNFQIQ